MPVAVWPLRVKGPAVPTLQVPQYGMQTPEAALHPVQPLETPQKEPFGQSDVVVQVGTSEQNTF